MPFTAFMDLYRDHIEENYHHIMSKSIEVFRNVSQDKKYHMSFLFDEFLGHMIYHKHSVALHSIFHEALRIITNPSIERVITRRINSHRYPTRFSTRRFFLDSERKMKENIEKLLLDSNAVVIYGDKITTCNKEIVEKIVCSSVKCFRLSVNSYIRPLSERGCF